MVAEKRGFSPLRGADEIAAEEHRHAPPLVITHHSVRHGAARSYRSRSAAPAFIQSSDEPDASHGSICRPSALLGRPCAFMA